MSKIKNNLDKIGVFVLMIFGLIAMIGMLYKVYFYVISDTFVEGKVVSISKSTKAGSTIEFINSENKKIQFTENLAFLDVKEGDSVQIRYNSEYPVNLYTDTTNPLWWAFCGFLLGLFCFIAGFSHKFLLFK